MPTLAGELTREIIGTQARRNFKGGFQLYRPCKRTIVVASSAAVAGTDQLRADDEQVNLQDAHGRCRCQPFPPFHSVVHVRQVAPSSHCSSRRARGRTTALRRATGTLCTTPSFHSAADAVRCDTFSSDSASPLALRSPPRAHRTRIICPLPLSMRPGAMTE